VAGLLEKVTNGSGTHYRHYIQGGTGTAAIHSRTAGGGNSTVYLHRDHLGSPELITDSSGNALVRPSFSAYGERRDGSDWDGAISSGDLNTLAGISRRGFTGHEHLDAVGLIHMNGRVYEPVAGRFLSRDPLIDEFGSSQGPNGYAYVHNNPLSLMDATGFHHECRPDEPDCVEVRGRRPEECDWGGPWMAGWGEFCREGWDPYWDHDPFGDFDDQPEDAGGGGGGGDSGESEYEPPTPQPAEDAGKSNRWYCRVSDTLSAAAGGAVAGATFALQTGQIAGIGGYAAGGALLFATVEVLAQGSGPTAAVIGGYVGVVARARGGSSRSGIADVLGDAASSGVPYGYSTPVSVGFGAAGSAIRPVLGLGRGMSALIGGSAGGLSTALGVSTTLGLNAFFSSILGCSP
jgi:RHS repeat-associated protein